MLSVGNKGKEDWKLQTQPWRLLWRAQKCYPEHNWNLIGSSLLTAKEGEVHFYKPILDPFPWLQFCVCFYHVFLSPLAYDSMCWASDSVCGCCSCHMHWVVLPTVEHMCTYFCTMNADREDIAELQIWIWLIHSLCLKPPYVFFRKWNNAACFPGYKTASHRMDACAAVWLGWQPSECEILALTSQVWSKFAMYCLMECFCNFKPSWWPLLG